MNKFTAEELIKLEERANKGDADAMYGVGLHRLNAGNYADALKEFLFAEARGHVEAQFEIGLIFYEGKGVPKDCSSAVSFLVRASDNGHCTAKFVLGEIFAGRDKYWTDRVFAYVWYSLAELCGHKEAAQKKNSLASLMDKDHVAFAKRRAEMMAKGIDPGWVRV